MGKGKNWYGERSSAKIPIATSHLIVCCGAETEKNYFDGVVKFFKNQEKNMLLKFYIEVDAVDPMNMANNVLVKTRTIEKKNNCKIDHVWLLFDKDDFSHENFNNAINKIQNTTNEQTKYHALWSNQCFELWLLLNFINLTASISRKAYIQKLEKYLQEHYEKNDKDIFDKVLAKGGNLLKAVENAKSLLDDKKTPANNDPATKVYEFFEHFEKYLGLTL